jgi:glucose/arabinose dehydrogenase/cytochrome c551/c552
MHPGPWLLAATLLTQASVSPRARPAPLDLEPDEARPGLVATYRSLTSRDRTFERVDAKPAFSLGRSSPDPRLPPGPFEVVWTGIIHWREQAPVSFHAFVGGELSVDVDGIKALEGRRQAETSRVGPATTVDRPPGHYRLTIRFRSLPDVPARLQLFWESPSFAREPLPAWILGHLATDRSATLARDEQIEHGRAAARRLGCARCHQSALPGIADDGPGPSLADSGRRLSRAWLLKWLDNPSAVRSEARMPALFPPTRRGFVERWLVAEALARPAGDREPKRDSGDHRAGRMAFLGIGCAACHFVPDIADADQTPFDRVRLGGLGDRFAVDDLAAFLGNPRARYPDGRMPRMPLDPKATRDIAAYLLLWSGPTPVAPSVAEPTAAEINDVARALGVHGKPAAAAALFKEKGCRSCHAGLGDSLASDIPLKAGSSKGCLSDQATPHYRLDAGTRRSLEAFLATAARESPPSSFVIRQQRLEQAGCVRCHQRDTDRPPPIEVIGSTLGSAYLQALPFLRTPRLTNPLQKFTAHHVTKSVRDGVAGLRPADYSYRMPAFGADAELLVEAIAEQDGELSDNTVADVDTFRETDPTLGTLHGPELIGPQGYGCISCHAWNGEQLSQPDPGSAGPDLTRVAGRIRRDWFDRYVESPMRWAPGTPMPAIFERGQPAKLRTVLDGDPVKQRDALWNYFLLGRAAPAPKPPPPVPIVAPAPRTPPLIARIPIRLPDGADVDSLSLLTACHDLVIYDLATGSLKRVFTGAQILRTVQGRTRRFLAAGSARELGGEPSLRFVDGKAVKETIREYRGYDLLPDGARVRWRLRSGAASIDFDEILRLPCGETDPPPAGERRPAGERMLTRAFSVANVPPGWRVELHFARDKPPRPKIKTPEASIASQTSDEPLIMEPGPGPEQRLVAELVYELAPAASPPAWKGSPPLDTERVEGSLARPGYRAIAYARPKTIAGEDRVMPVALAADPRDGRLFVMSLKTGELFVLRDPHDNGQGATFEEYGRGLFQDAYAMLAERDGLLVLHRRNLARIVDANHDGTADRVESVASFPQGVADSYDYGYGLVRDKTGGLIVSFAPYANTSMPGSGGAVRLAPGKPPQPIAYGFRNPLGWCAGPNGEIFSTDNQGEWVAANKLCHIVEGRFYGFPNSAQKEHARKPAGRTAVWVPYAWAHSINGVAFDATGGKFGPFAGQFFLAELMFGGAIIRADLERVNGEYQGACFPFWGKGLLAPVSLAFDPRGRLFIGALTEPGWMAQPDRGALFRIDYTGQLPFEIQSIHVRPRGFRITLTAAAAKASAIDTRSYRVEHYRYEYTGAYGSPELDRTTAAVEHVALVDDRTIDVDLPQLARGRVYLISAPGVRSAAGAPLVHPVGAYTLNEIPSE